MPPLETLILTTTTPSFALYPTARARSSLQGLSTLNMAGCFLSSTALSLIPADFSWKMSCHVFDIWRYMGIGRLVSGRQINVPGCSGLRKERPDFLAYRHDGVVLGFFGLPPDVGSEDRVWCSEDRTDGGLSLEHVQSRAAYPPF